MRILMNEYALNKQPVNKKGSPSFQKMPQLPSQDLLVTSDSFVRKAVADYTNSDPDGKARIMSKINTKLVKLYTQRLQPFWERLRTKESIEMEIARYKTITKAFQTESLPI